MLLGYDHGLGVTWDGGKNWYHPDFLPLAQFYAIDYRHVLSLPRRRRPPGQRQPDGPEHQRRRRAAASGRSRRAGRPSASRIGSAWAAATGCTTSSTGPTNRTLYNESQFGPLSRVDLVTGESKSIAYQRHEARDALELVRADPRLGP